MVYRLLLSPQYKQILQKELFAPTNKLKNPELVTQDFLLANVKDKIIKSSVNRHISGLYLIKFFNSKTRCTFVSRFKIG
ncbi:MAG: hypothetical protein DI539_00400 [Flavobacterium psychrophilum]|nr:MAG: hypothetical protein DI539_00400 [Flavobacterium psychrophilum]